MLDATWDQEADKWYYSQGDRSLPVAKTITLTGDRTVSMDIDYYGRIIGVEVI